MKTPIALTIAGSDSGGGAGIQADLKAFSALGVYGASAVTAVTAQNTLTVSAVHEVPADVVAGQVEAVLSDLNVGAIKIGMLFSTAIIEAVADVLPANGPPIVVDPVMIAKSGDSLLQADAVDALKELIFPLATLITPNLPEASVLSGLSEAENVPKMRAQASQLGTPGRTSVLIKGGHGTTDVCTDVLLDTNGNETVFSTPRIPTRNTHGTGCTFSAAIAAQLALGHSLTDSVGTAHRYLNAAIDHAHGLRIGNGHGPVHHFHALWGGHG